MTNKEHTQQQVLGLSFAIFDNNMNSLINEINYAITKSETPEWREQLECSLVLMQEIRERVSEAMIVIDGYERKQTIAEKFLIGCVLYGINSFTINDTNTILS